MVDPKNPSKQYYWIENAEIDLVIGGYPVTNFLRSEDGGKSWGSTLQSHLIKFEDVIMHSKTGVLYAQIVEVIFRKDEDGALNPSRSIRLVKSSNGYNWQDVSAEALRAYNILQVSEDRVNSDRICVILTDEDGTGAMIANDDALSSWTRYDGSAWAEIQKHFPELDTLESPEGEQDATPKSDRAGG